MRKLFCISIACASAASFTFGQITFDANADILINFTGDAAEVESTLNDATATPTTWNNVVVGDGLGGFQGSVPDGSQALNAANGFSSGVTVSWSNWGAFGQGTEDFAPGINPVWLTNTMSREGLTDNGSNGSVTFTGLQTGENYTLYGFGDRTGGSGSELDPSLTVEGITDDTFTVWTFTKDGSDAVNVGTSSATYQTFTGAPGYAPQIFSFDFVAGASGEATLDAFSSEFGMLDGLVLSGPVVVPEPSTYAALIGGLALCITLLRRRR